MDRAALIEAAATAIRADTLKSFSQHGSSFEADSPTTWRDYVSSALAVVDAVLPLVAQAIEDAEAIRKDGAAVFRGLDMPVAAGAADFQAAGIGFAADLVRSLAEEGTDEMSWFDTAQSATDEDEEMELVLSFGETVKAVPWGTFCQRGGGHIDTEGCCGTKGPRLLVEVSDTDSPARVALWIQDLREMFSGSSSAVAEEGQQQ